MAMTAMITLVGFELLMAQELQFVHGLSPYEAGVFMLPVMVASGFSTDFSTQQWQAWGLMALLGFSAASALLASTSAIMAAAPAEKAAAAGAIETMAYEDRPKPSPLDSYAPSRSFLPWYCAAKFRPSTRPKSRCRKQRRSYDRSRKNRSQRISDQQTPDGFCLCQRPGFQYGCL